jgi:hypothetical protein
VLLAILGLVLELFLHSFWSFVKAVAASPSILIERGTVEFLLAVVSPVTLTLFGTTEINGPSPLLTGDSWGKSRALPLDQSRENIIGGRGREGVRRCRSEWARLSFGGTLPRDW